MHDLVKMLRSNLRRPASQIHSPVAAIVMFRIITVLAIFLFSASALLVPDVGSPLLAVDHRLDHLENKEEPTSEAVTW